MNLVERAKALSRGVMILYQWVSDGIVVEKSLAQSRAEVCKKCSSNQSGLKLPSSVECAIKEQLELKNNLEIRVEGEKSLHTCEVCLCCLRLKVWTPRELLVKYETSDSLNKFPPHCWMRTEGNLQ